MRTTISQREARRLRARVKELEEAEQRRRVSWVEDYPGGALIDSRQYGSEDSGHVVAVRTARKCRCAVVAVDRGDVVRYYALPLGPT